jgi:hypothetical protein
MTGGTIAEAAAQKIKRSPPAGTHAWPTTFPFSSNQTWQPGCDCSRVNHTTQTVAASQSAVEKCLWIISAHWRLCDNLRLVETDGTRRSYITLHCEQSVEPAILSPDRRILNDPVFPRTDWADVMRRSGLILIPRFNVNDVRQRNSSMHGVTQMDAEQRSHITAMLFADYKRHRLGQTPRLPSVELGLRRKRRSEFIGLKSTFREERGMS